MDKKLKILGVGDPAVDVYVNEKYKIIEEYKKNQIEILFDIVPWQKYLEKFKEALCQKEKYDIVMIPGHLWLYELVEKKYLYELNYEKEDILDVIFDEMKFENKLYLSPSFCDGHMIIYDKEIFEKNRIQIDEVITVDEYIKIVEKLKNKGIETPIALKADRSEIFTDILPYLRNYGKDVYTLENNKIVCNLKNMNKEIKKYLSLKEYSPKNTQYYTNEKIAESFINGETVMITTWSGQIGLINKLINNSRKIGYSTFDTSWNVTWAFGILKESDKKEEACEFLKYLRSREVDKKVGFYCGSPVRLSNYVDEDKMPWYETQLKMLEKYSKPLIMGNLIKEKIEGLYGKIYDVFCEKKELEEMLREIE